MKIKEIVEISATLLARDDITEFLEKGVSSGYSSTEKDVAILTRCANMTISEIAAYYSAFITKETVISNNGIINYSNLSKNMLEIINIYDEFDNKLSYKLDTSGYAKTKPGKVKVEYSFLPPTLALLDDTGIANEKITPALLAYGVSAEYLLISGMIETSVTFFSRYKDGLDKIFMVKNARIKARSFL